MIISAKPMTDRLQKLLAHAGMGSRREIEGWIDEGRISVNGKRASLGDRACASDRILLDGKQLRLTSQSGEQIKAILYHKPEGEICTRTDPKGRTTIFENLPAIPNGRWVSVGRLDLNTSGLLLLTNSGELANRLMHPSTGLEREYLVRIRGQVSQESLTKLTKEGVMLDGRSARFDRILSADLAEEGTNHWYRVVIKEGRYREVRRLWEAVGHPVSRLKRIRYGSVTLPRDVKRGKHSKLAPKQLEKLVSSVGLMDEFAHQLYSGRRASSTTRKPLARKPMSGKVDRKPRSRHTSSRLSNEGKSPERKTKDTRTGVKGKIDRDGRSKTKSNAKTNSKNRNKKSAARQRG